jgi:predicted hydrolase (HD superfamily)
MELKGALKRIKEKTFAANVSRDDIHDACQRAGIELNTLISFIISHQAAYQLS